MNNYSAIGRIAMDPKIGNGVLTSLLAIKRIYKSSDGVDADFIPITLFGKQADNFDRLTKKGDKIGIDGRIKTSAYKNEQGQAEHGFSVVIDHFYLLSTKPHNASPKLSDATFTSLSTKLRSASSKAKVTVSDNELPF
ncbi:Single-stranded DNA-binding protein SsbB [Lacticaseibacillus paracasei]|uniref:single-stranded DNA-binding protein n=1 Tax=Lacticaseibacillus paracasei TaxID=1597 RepID=UPI000F0B9D8C|nr:single-stranded DNA-binding protein [Lacticaseibacillus paracasei]RNE47517.1 Single-stranded DNA-binding protein SsbB [Lacticaseibacillus paracasei]